MRRREFIASLGSAAAWPVVAQAQQPIAPVIGMLLNAWVDKSDYLIAPFLDGLRDTGFVEGRNVRIEYRWANGQNERLPVLAAELVASRVSVIVALVGSSGALAAKQVTSTIPIVFLTAGDAVQLGLVTNLAKPEGNLTGVSGVTNLPVTKQFGLLGELISTPAPLALLVNVSSPNATSLQTHMQEAAKSVNRELKIIPVRTQDGMEIAFSEMAGSHVGGLIIPANALFFAQREQIIALSAKYRIPTIYDQREYPEAGGLISYGIDGADVRHQLGIYVGKILHGTKPSDLPVFQPTKFELLINLKAAKTLGLDIPPTILARADEVIE